MRRPTRFAFSRLAIALLTMLCCAVPSEARWFDDLIGAGRQAGKSARSSLDDAARTLTAFPPRSNAAHLAATVSQEGHWTFVNKAGERLTTASPDELKRAVALLTPELPPVDGKLAIVLTEDAVFRHRQFMKELPATAELRLAIGQDTYRLLARAGDGGPRLLAEVRPRVTIEVGEIGAFREALWQADRPLERSRTRLLALEPGGPQSLPARPSVDSSTGQALVDAVDPFRLGEALKGLSGQTVIVIGRVDGEKLFFRPSAGPEQAVLTTHLHSAARASDVDLVVLSTSQTRQPGTRNWLWQRMEVAGLDNALKRVRMADFLDVLAGNGRHFVVTAAPVDDIRTSLRAIAVNGALEAPNSGGVVDLLSEMVSDMTGRIVSATIEANVTSAGRTKELSSRIVPGIPSELQFGYLGLLVFGLMGFPAARNWWRRFWPPEQRSEYAGASGYRAAVAVKTLAFVLLFLPFVGIPALMWTVALQVWAVVTIPWRAWSWVSRRRGGVAQPT